MQKNNKKIIINYYIDIFYITFLFSFLFLSVVLPRYTESVNRIDIPNIYRN